MVHIKGVVLHETAIQKSCAYYMYLREAIPVLMDAYLILSYMHSMYVQSGIHEGKDRLTYM